MPTGWAGRKISSTSGAVGWGGEGVIVTVAGAAASFDPNISLSAAHAMIAAPVAAFVKVRLFARKVSQTSRPETVDGIWCPFSTQ